jgi:hypothetical protein
MYSLIDAEAYRGHRILVVGGGDSAVEVAMGFAHQPGNQVTLSYRGDGFCRIIFAGGTPPTDFLEKIGVQVGPCDLTDEAAREAHLAAAAV